MVIHNFYDTVLCWNGGKYLFYPVRGASSEFHHTLEVYDTTQKEVIRRVPCKDILNEGVIKAYQIDPVKSDILYFAIQLMNKYKFITLDILTGEIKVIGSLDGAKLNTRIFISESCKKYYYSGPVMVGNNWKLKVYSFNINTDSEIDPEGNNRYEAIVSRPSFLKMEKENLLGVSTTVNKNTEFKSIGNNNITCSLELDDPLDISKIKDIASLDNETLL